jgi:hypothetical protein
MEDTEIHQLDPAIEYVKIHGLQRTGTNYLSHLVNENFEKTQVLVNLGGWKHGHYHAPWFLGQEVHVLVLAKHPYSWLVSIYKYWNKKRELRIGMDLNGVSFDNFVRNKAIFELQRDIPYLFRASNPIQHWNNMYFHWMTVRMNAKNVCFIKYEELLSNPESTVDKIGQTFGLQRKSGTFVDSKNDFAPAGELLRQEDSEFKAREYYLQDEYFKSYTPELLDFVNKELDLEVLDHYNYWLLPPSEL